MAQLISQQAVNDWLAKHDRRGKWKAETILEFIRDMGSVRYGDLQRLVCTLNGIDYDEKEWDQYLDTILQRFVKVKETSRRAHRGVYGTNFCTLLPRYCSMTKEGGFTVYRLKAPIQGPYYPTRNIPRFDGSGGWRKPDFGEFYKGTERRPKQSNQ